jgi:N-acetylglutamate synthase-like GNAT family acetyltransferase
VPILCTIIRNAYLEVAQRFGLNPENCPKHPSNCTELWIENDLAKGVTYYLLETEGRHAGCAALEVVDEKLCYLERVAVLPEFKGQGLGRRLVLHLIEAARGLGMQKIGIGIIAEQRELMRWYQRIGFKKGETKRFGHLPFEVMFMSCRIE